MVGERIRYYRKRQKMTLRVLGEKSGFENRGDVRIAQYENGSRVPRTGTLNRIATVSYTHLEGHGLPYRRRT